MRRRVILLSAASLCASAALFGGLHTEDGPQHVLEGPSPADPAPAATGKQRRVQGRFLHITDFHPDSFYKTHSSTDQKHACHRGHGSAGYFGTAASDCDTPFSLVNATFDWIEANLKDNIDFVIWTGDTARHDSDEHVPRSSKEVLGTNKLFAQKFRDLFYDKKAEALSVPVIPTLGNNDLLPHNIMLPGPNRWLTSYARLWRHFIPEEQRHSFQIGGWFYVEVVPKKLAVVSLNTLYFFDRNAAIDNCVDTSEPGFKQLEWLRVQLHLLRSRGMKAIIMGHVPPARTDSKRLWDESCWQKYTLWLQQYRDVVTASLFGHMNIDHFMLQDTHDINIQTVASGVYDQGARVSMDDELTTQGAHDYLLELRHRWSKLPKPVTAANGDPSDDPSDDPSELTKGKKGGKGKKTLGGRWAERYQLSIVGPSIVPTFFPTLRVIEYNITGMEDSQVSTGPVVQDSEVLSLPEFDEWESDLRAAALVEVEKKKKKKKKKKGKKGGKTHDPNLVVPDPPSKSAPPGPAYSPQPLTLVGYTQYFANLTYLNNDIDTSRWREGKHSGEEPDKSKPPRDFAFEIEYSTFKDTILKMSDLTVRSYIKLAYRMGRQQTNAKIFDSSEDASWDQVYDDKDIDDDDDDFYDLASDEDDLIEQYGNGTVTDQKKKKKDKDKKKKKKKKQRKYNKVWLHFLRHAFVSTVDEKDLKKLDR